MKLTVYTALLLLLFSAASVGVFARQSAKTPDAAVSVEEIRKALGKPETVAATVSAIDYNERLVVLRGDSGAVRTLYVGQDVTKLKNVKVGDRIKLTYYMSLATEVLQPGQQPSPARATDVVPTSGSAKPGGTMSEQMRWVVTVNEVDLPTQTVTVTTEKGRTIAFKAADKAKISQLKPNDRVEVVITAAAVISVEPGK
jgi:Cu/Ag efflux protein CusF